MCVNNFPKLTLICCLKGICLNASKDKARSDLDKVKLMFIVQVFLCFLWKAAC